MKNFLFAFCITFISFSYSQTTKKTVSALRITKSPTIDGVLNEPFWEKAQEAKDFVMFEPGDGGNERDDKKTTVKIAYDNEAIYFGATMYDPNPEEIPMQFGGRDQFGTVDYFLISINPNNDGLNDTEFIVMSTGAQGDAKVSSGREDFSWNAVWDSSVKINNDSWVAEIKIPYSALRFSNTNIQTWGVNFHRRINKLNEQYVWNYIDKKVGEITQYCGEIIGIKDIKPPTRLSFSPYASSSYTTFNDDSEFSNSIGMDLKYGINESFTLDATLIPDFGQTAFDDQVLNLGPFEQRYEEKRAFFTEGTELFDKGGLFYSRRVGNAPVNYYDIEDNLNENEALISNPEKVNMLNAIKISGRTKKGLGIGVFNAITEKTSATIKNNETGEIRKEVTEPLANYNLLVLDQQFNKNSSVSLVNSNVLRSGNFRDANVTALLFDISDKQNKYNIKGNYKLSNVNEFGENNSGYSTFLEIAKISGNIQYEIGHWRVNNTYDIKDLGYQSRNNLANYFSEISYQIFEPTKTLSNFRITFQNEFRYQNNPNKYSGNNFELNFRFITLNRLAYGGKVESSIGNQYDFYEPRVEGRFFKENARFFTNGWISTDYRKKFAVDLRGFYFKRYNDLNKTYSINFSPRFRFSDKFEIIHAIDFRKSNNEKGYVNELDNGAIIFGNRASKTVTNTLSSKLSFSTKSSLALSFRHYWSPVTYDTIFFELNSDGNLNSSSYSENHDINYNIWNLDLSYFWEFAPGSQLVALYRNSIFNEDDLSGLRFKENLDNLFKEPVTNNISLKLIYYLDYNNLKTWL
jgi:hypothetical protein